MSGRGANDILDTENALKTRFFNNIFFFCQINQKNLFFSPFLYLNNHYQSITLSLLNK